ncbi:MAG: beta-ketoacyl-ACP synthase III [Rhodospirillales bacterium]
MNAVSAEPRAYIAGCGSFLPERIVTNDELAKTVDTSDEWITARTGIRERRIAGADEKTSDLAHRAAEAALKHAEIDARDLDLVIVATTTPDQTFPATATRVQAMLGMTNGAAFDIQAVCSGFVYGLSVADSFVRSGQARNVMLIGAEIFSRILDWEDRGTCVLFGDGAGAVVVRHLDDAPKDPPGADGGANRRGILSTHLHSDGTLNGLLYVDGGVATTGTVGHLRMQGKEVFKNAVVNLAAVVDEALEANGLSHDDLDWLVPHQANKRILDSTAKKLGLPKEKIIITVDRHANTSAASIPLALDEGVRDGRVKRGDLVLVEAMGGGLTWGAGLLRW